MTVAVGFGSTPSFETGILLSLSLLCASVFGNRRESKRCSSTSIQIILFALETLAELLNEDRFIFILIRFYRTSIDGLVRQN